MTEIVRLIGVYDADGSVIGELTYFLRKRAGRAHCALCEITHGRVRERAAWRAARARLPVPFVAFHRDDQPDEVRGAGAPPLVLAETTQGELVLLLDANDLERCAGSTDRLIEHINRAAGARHLEWPTLSDLE